LTAAVIEFLLYSSIASGFPQNSLHLFMSFEK
jgi:hypothetical protein